MVLIVVLMVLAGVCDGWYPLAGYSDRVGGCGMPVRIVGCLVPVPSCPDGVPVDEVVCRGISADAMVVCVWCWDKGVVRGWGAGGGCGGGELGAACGSVSAAQDQSRYPIPLKRMRPNSFLDFFRHLCSRVRELTSSS